MQLSYQPENACFRWVVFFPVELSKLKVIKLAAELQKI